jgi:branched-chain amino acid transport system permease protein
MNKVGKSPTVLGLIGAVAIYLALSQANVYWWDLAIRIGFNIALALVVNLLVGIAGQISLGHAAFVGIGAYASGVLTSRYGLSPLAGIGSGMALAAAISWIVGSLVLSLRGYYLAMATLGVGIITSIVITNQSPFTNGPDGLAVPALSIGSVTVSDERSWFLIAASLVLLALKATRNLVNSPFGRSLRALHGSTPAASMNGIDVAKAKTQVFVISATVASFVGSLMAHYTGFITPQIAGFFHSIELVMMVVIGGLGSTLGAVVGAVLLTVMPQYLAKFEGLEMVFFGGILMFVVVFFPRGIAPSIATIVKRPKLSQAGSYARS